MKPETPESVARQAYEKASGMMNNPSLRAVVRHGLSILYGPPMVQPDLALITFQGGGADSTIQNSWPRRLLYLDDPYKFGTALRTYMSAVGLRKTLEERTVALPAIFPQAPTSEASKWLTKSGPRAEWREFSRYWIEKLVDVQRPKLIVVFGEKASKVLGIAWSSVEREHAQGHMTFASSEWRGFPAIFCHHLSIGCPEQAALRCLSVARDVIGSTAK